MDQISYWFSSKEPITSAHVIKIQLYILSLPNFTQVLVWFVKQADGVLEESTNMNGEETRAVKGSKKKKKQPAQRDENYIPHFASDQHTEAG